MLVLSRKCGESVMLGDDVEIFITEIAGDKVKIGIRAPVSTTILRKELYQTIEENRQAAHAAPPKDMRKLFGSFGLKH